MWFWIGFIFVVIILMFILCYTRMVGDLFLVAPVLVAAAAVVVVPVIVDVGQNAIESSEPFYILVTSPWDYGPLPAILVWFVY